jgi:DNA-directed RNA polymerase subunit H (RpoH/RPB5)
MDVFTYDLYLNIVSFVKFRGYNITSEILNEETFNKNKKYVTLTIETDGPIIILTKYILQNMKSDSIIREINNLSKGFNEIIVFAKDPTKIGSIGNINGSVSVYAYENFIINIMKSDLIPKHEIISDEQFYKETNLKTKNIPMISENEIISIWLNAKKGNIVKIYNISQHSGIAIYYRVVV